MTIEPICFSCKHINEGTLTCKAFPIEIPMDLLLGKVSHKKPLKNQGNDFVYEELIEDK